SYVAKLYSPHHDLGVYQELIPSFLEAGHLGLNIFNNIQSSINSQMRFLLPWGLSMARTKSIQLLHFPPLETFVYLDYLYSPTNRRWENLLGYNDPEVLLSEEETIVDCVPVAAPGDDSAGIAPLNNSFAPYVKAMLQARLGHLGHAQTPIVAYGEPVMAWLKANYGDQIAGDLQPLSLVELQLWESGVKHHVLCANHPSKYLYYTDKHDKADFEVKKQIMTQDLIAAGWQSKMVKTPGHSPVKLLQELKQYWTDNPRVPEIMLQEDRAYGYKI
ncbi:MAG TPA: hypothetical protein VLA58_09080, partial [Chitinophagaceae bacterium]|nr:hypothetical protein [Chitinophagaceae bacterium]